jgi:imidazole glycerol-phosphate synthase subunit HisF
VLAKRVIPIQLFLDGRLVKTRKFADWRHVGTPVKSSSVYNSAHADELLLLNIARENRTVLTMRPVLEEVSRAICIPLSVGGGISSLEDAKELLWSGADRVVINSAAYNNLGLVSSIAATFGVQAVVVSIDVRFDGAYRLFSNCGQTFENVSLTDHIHRCIAAGAGEIMIQSIDRDGTMSGFDIELVSMVKEISSVPVIAAGGSGNYEHLREAFETDIAAVACGSLFNFSDSNPIRAKTYLSNYGLTFRTL